MKTHEYKTNIGKELETWRERLAAVTGRIDELPSIEKYRMTPYIEGLHILLTEMDDRIGELKFYKGRTVHPQVVEKEACNFNECEGVRYDYDFGG